MSKVSDAIKTAVLAPVDDLGVFSWSPGEDGAGVPPTQVHLIWNVKGFDATFLMRLKSREAADSLIAALIENRDYVWGSEDAK